MPRSLARPRHPLAAFLMLLAAVALGGSPAGAIDTQAREAILVDMTTGSVLFEKDADQRMPTASMSKIMTMFMVFEALEDGRLELDDRLLVSEQAWRMGGSRMFVEVDTRVRVEDLIRGVIVQSGNDASVVLAEGLAGSEAEFARRMTERAHGLGMHDSNFMNATGWPDPEHYSTARDLATLAAELITTFPQYYGYYSETEFQYGVGLDGEPMDPQHNRNPLLYRDIGADGLKTGHTREAGYGLTASAVRGDRRLILVINGLPSASARAEEAVRLMSWGFREFDALELFEAGETVATAEVWMGEAAEVPMVLGEDLAITLRQGQRDDLELVARLEEPVPAPIVAGEPIGTLVISAPDMPVREEPLLAAETVERRGFLGRVAGAIGHYALSLM
jgi:D-alanyl-D-alanine carboxypeptidase (penicillin-binding protein 5/6)